MVNQQLVLVNRLCNQHGLLANSYRIIWRCSGKEMVAIECSAISSCTETKRLGLFLRSPQHPELTIFVGYYIFLF